MRICIDEIAEERTEQSGLPDETNVWGETRRIWIVSEIRSDRNHLAVEVRCDDDKTSREGAHAILSSIYDHLS